MPAGAIRLAPNPAAKDRWSVTSTDPALDEDVPVPSQGLGMSSWTMGLIDEAALARNGASRGEG